FDWKVHQFCCNLGTDYSTRSENCATFPKPVPGISASDEKLCLSAADFCCKKQLKIQQCELGLKDAGASCSTQDGERKDCCEACQLGIELSKSKEQCVDMLERDAIYSQALIKCCKDPYSININVSTPTTTTQKSTSKLSTIISEEEFTRYPGLSEENVCETGEYCAQLCEPSGKSFKCACFEGYQLMKDGVSCRPIKQAKGSRCQINNPCDHDCTDTGTSIVCSCKNGYRLQPDNRTCIDIDECALGIHSCELGEECENDEGTYFCFETQFENEDLSNKCPVGHKFNPEKLVCDDINECEFDLICPPPKTCTNTIGSYYCEGPSCPPGFKYKPSIESCSDIDECLTGENDCNRDSQVCVNTKGNYTCIDKASKAACPPGFKKNSLTFVCEDINECEDDVQVCRENEECINEEGEYRCVLKTLYNKGITANKSKDVSCPNGFEFNEYTKLCEDINECESNPCPLGLACSNFNGTYKCNKLPECQIGYELNELTGECMDINECQLRIDNCSDVTHRCDNTIGSFYCTRIVSCGTGYTLNSARDLCEDDDECKLGTHNCNELGSNYQCKNQMGTYKCEMIKPIERIPPSTTSSTTTTTRTTTTKKTTSTAPPTTTPATTPERATPYVPPFFYKPISEKPFNNIIPINQPNFYNPPIPKQTLWPFVRPSFTSSTTPRYSPITETSKFSFYYPYQPTNNYRPILKVTSSEAPIIQVQKKCLPGYRINEYGNCIDINECESNPCPAGTKCSNFNGRYECSSPLQCHLGYEPNESMDECVDIDECARGTHKCDRSQICKNGKGFYTCECPPGHHRDFNSQICEDIDECKYYRPCGPNSNCINTIGSFKCECKSGLYLNQSTCEDINECVTMPNLCEHKCVNLWGSHRCACKTGYILRNDKRTCEDIDECEKYKDRKLCVGTCRNIPGSYSCDCPAGYTLGSDKRVCVDIDECKQKVCGPTEACLNTRGSYKCYPINCDNYYIRDPNHNSRCKRITCDPRDNQCLLLPEQYSFQVISLVSNMPLPAEGITLCKVKGPSWNQAAADFSIELLEVRAPSDIPRVDNSYIRREQYPNNTMVLHLVKSIEGPQEFKIKVEMKLSQRNIPLGSVVVYLIIAVSEYSF
ncbi:hypothetical protein GWI33_002838, partial [Rhynchophorus ferrugineus]